MNFQFKHPKFKPKLLILLLAVLIVAEPLITHFQPPLTTYAAGGTMTDGSVTPTRGNVPGGAKYDRTGWLFWISDEDGGNRSTVFCYINNTAGIIDRNGKPLPAENVHLQNRFGDPAVNAIAGIPAWGTPFDANGNGRGMEVKEFLLSEGNEGKKAYDIVKVLWGEEEATKWNQRERVLVFEPVYWNMVYENGVGTGIWQCGTANWWGEYQHVNGINADDVGDKWINKYTNNLYAHCVQFEIGIPSIGITAGYPTGLVTNTEMANKGLGYGIGVVWNDNNSIHTYWEVNGSPGDPEPRDGKEGLCNIVKGYYEENLTTGAKVPVGEGIYTEELVTNQIVISNEPGFELVEWRISDTTSSSLDPTNWVPPGNTTSPSTTPTTVQLISPQSCVYVLLKRSYEEPSEDIDYNFKITESQITRRVHFSKPDVQGTMPKIQDYKFLFQNPAHTIECGGHTCDEGCENADCTCDLTNGGTCTTNHGKKSMKQ